MPEAPEESTPLRIDHAAVDGTPNKVKGPIPMPGHHHLSAPITTHPGPTVLFQTGLRMLFKQ